MVDHIMGIKGRSNTKSDAKETTLVGRGEN